jgi:predicted GIY-YIG superfamily endonuclease
MYLIYVHTNRLNGKRYVGFTKKSMEKRSNSHMGKSWKMIDGKRVVTMRST